MAMGSTFSTLIPWEERTRKSYDIAGEIGPQVFAIPGIMAFSVVPPSFDKSSVKVSTRESPSGRNSKG